MRPNFLVLCFFCLVVNQLTGLESKSLKWTTAHSDLYDFEGTLVFCNTASGHGYFDGADEEPVCSSPGPTLLFTPGTNYKLTLVNQADVATNIHTHGMHLSGEGNADDSSKAVEAGLCLGYNLSIPLDHSGGTYWYHSHAHPNGYTQINSGALGMIIVSDTDARGDIQAMAAVTDPQARQRIKALLGGGLAIMLARIQGQPQFTDVSGADFTIPAFQWTRVRLAVAVANGASQTIRLTSADESQQNADDERPYFILPLQGEDDNDDDEDEDEEEDNPCLVHTLAHDGVLVSYQPGPKHREWRVSGAGRLDLILYCTQEPRFEVMGSSFQLSLAYNSQPSDETLDSWAPVRPSYLADLSQVEVPSEHVFPVYSGVTAFSWNGVFYAWPQHPSAQCDNQEAGRDGDNDNENEQENSALSFGGIYEMVLTQTHIHPIHLHVYPMQVVSQCEGYLEGQWYDTISTPTAAACRVRFHAATFGGKTLIHCHNVIHADMGAMTYITLCGGPSIGAVVDPPPIQFFCSDL